MASCMPSGAIGSLPRVMRISDIRPDDVVLADKKGRRVFGLVTEVEEDGVRFRPLVPNTTYRHASAREVIGHWRKAGRPRAAGSPPPPPPQVLAGAPDQLPLAAG
jgi:hypothetical protein